MTALVFGASGFVGTRLVQSLASHGLHVRAVDLLPPRVNLPSVTYIQADVRSPLDRAIGDGVDAIYNLAAVHRTPGHADAEYYETNVWGSLNVTRLADACGIDRLVFTSSISVYGPSENILDEAAPLNAVSAYGRSKKMAESIHRLWLEQRASRKLVVVRPGVVFGPGERGNYSALAAALKGGYFFFPGRKDTVKSGGYVDELLLAISFALDHDNRYALFNFAYPELSTIDDIVRTFAAIGGFKAQHPTVPLLPMLGAAALFEQLSRLGLRSSIHRERILKLNRSTKVAPRWLLSSGYVFSSTLPEALRRWSEETSGRFV